MQQTLVNEWLRCERNNKHIVFAAVSGKLAKFYKETTKIQTFEDFPHQKKKDWAL